MTPATARMTSEDGTDDIEEVETNQLVIGTLLPVTGDLAFLGPPEVAGARLAVADINAAGGVFGSDVVLHEGDSGDTNQDIANPEVDRLLALDVDAIIGAASSAVSKLVIDKITGNYVIHFSPANTSPDFTTYNDNGLYFRTAPSDLLQGKVLADLVASEGNEIAGVIFRQESYGQGLADSFRDNFETLGGTVDPFIAYAPGTDNFDAEVDQLAGANPDAIVVIGFQESATILVTMHERGHRSHFRHQRVRSRRKHRRHRRRAFRSFDHRGYAGYRAFGEPEFDLGLHRPVGRRLRGWSARDLCLRSRDL